MSRQNPRRRTPVYILSLRRFRGAGPTREHGEPARKKTETRNKAEAGKKCMSGRRVEERVKSSEATKGTRGSQRPSKGRAQGRGHSRHTASTTPHRDTGEGRTRGTREERHHAPRRAGHRHHTHLTHPTSPGSPPSGRAVEGGTAPDPRRPSQWWRAPPQGTPFRHPHSEQRQPARAHAVGPVPGPHASTDRTRDTRDAEPWLPAPGNGRPGEGQRLTPGAPHNGGGPPPPGTAPNHSRGMQPPLGMQAKGTVLGSHTNTPAPTAPGWRTPTARPVGGQLAEGRRPASGAHHNGGRHPPRGRPSATPTASNPARKGARCGASAGSPRPHRPHPGNTGRGTLAVRSRGRAAGGGTAPDTRRPSQRWKATPPGTAPHHPRGMQPPQGMQAKGTVLGAHTARGWRTPTARPVGGQSGEGRRLTPDAPHNGGKHPPPGTPFRHPHSEQRQPARAHAVGPMLGPHARTDRTRDTRDAEPWLPAPEEGRPGEGQRLTPGAPHNGGRPPPPGTAPHQPRGMQPPQGMQAAGTVLGSHTHTPAPRARG